MNAAAVSRVPAAESAEPWTSALNAAATILLTPCRAAGSIHSLFVLANRNLVDPAGSAPGPPPPTPYGAGGLDHHDRLNATTPQAVKQKLLILYNRNSWAITSHTEYSARMAIAECDRVAWGVCPRDADAGEFAGERGHAPGRAAEADSRDLRPYNCNHEKRCYYRPNGNRVLRSPHGVRWVASSLFRGRPVVL